MFASEGGYNSRTRKDAPFPASTHDPLLVLLLRSIAASLTQHSSSIAVQADVPSLVPILSVFAFLEKVLFRGEAAK